MRERRMAWRSSKAFAISVTLMATLTACEAWNKIGEPAAAKPATARYPVDPDIAKLTKHPYRSLKDSRGALLGDLKTGFALPTLFDEDDERGNAPRQAGASVNTFLWRAALDTVGFLPIEIADVQGGVIRTDWYEDRNRPDQRFKVQVFVISDELRPDGVQVGVFREERESPRERWQQADPSPEAAAGLRTIILDRATELAGG
ncbi:MAG: DUF3576 domain-containing protein [Geminicoccaceae bacterium]